MSARVQTRGGARDRRRLLVIAFVALVGCSERDADAPAAAGAVTIEVWAHAGQESERQVIQDQITRFNDSQSDVRATLRLLPEGSYNSQLQAAALAGDLPDLIEFDGPYVYNYVWQGHLVPLDGLLPAPLTDDLLDSIIAQGTYQGRLYSVGSFDSGLGLWANRRKLQQAGVRIPDTVDAAWTADEFDGVLAALAAHDEDGAVLDLKLNYRGEWYTYAFSPVIQSAGGDLIDRSTFTQRIIDRVRTSTQEIADGVRTDRIASGVLNGAAAVRALGRVQSWIGDGYVDANLDDHAFAGERVALSWAGHWEYGRYREALGEALVLLPLPDFGNGTRTGQGSWNWGITRAGEHPEAAARLLAFLFQPEEVLAMTNANGAVPGTYGAIERSPEFRPGGRLRLFVDLLEQAAVPRPRTPAYPVITSAFQQAFDDIRHGVDVQTALDRAAAVIDEDIRSNRGYPAP